MTAFFRTLGSGIFLGSLLAASAWASSGTTPYAMNFSGYLEQSSVPANGSYEMRFQLLVSGTSVWCEELTGVSVSDGDFSVALGSSSDPQGPEGYDPTCTTLTPSDLSLDPALVSSVSSSTPVTISVQVYDSSAWETLSPSLSVSSSVFALQADTAETASSATTTSQLQGVAVSGATPTDGQVLQYSSGSTEWEPATISGGGGTPGGNSGQVQFNNSSSFGGSPNLVWDNTNSRLGIGASAPQALLQLAAGTTAVAPLMLTTGANLSTPLSGAIEYDGSNLYFTNSSSQRQTLAVVGGSQTYSGNNTYSGTVSVSNSTSSTSDTTGAVLVTGGEGVQGAINAGGAVTSGSTMSASTSLTTPIIYGSSSASGTLTLDGTSNATAGNVLINPSGGDVGIGTTSPAAGLDVEHAPTGVASPGVVISDGSGAMDIGTVAVEQLYQGASTTNHVFDVGVGSSSYTGTMSYWYTNTGATTSFNFVQMTSGGSGVMFGIDGDGDVSAHGNVTAASVIYSSDQRLKKDIQPISSPLEGILSLDGVTYFWNDLARSRGLTDPNKQMGVIAQKVEKVFPEAVHVDKDGYRAVNYPSLVAPLIGAVKELYRKWETSSSRQDRAIASLKDQVGELQRSNKKLELQNGEMRKFLCQSQPKADFCGKGE